MIRAVLVVALVACAAGLGKVEQPLHPISYVTTLPTGTAHVTAEHHEHVLSLDNAEYLQNVMCTEDGLTMFFETPANAEQFSALIAKHQQEDIADVKLVGHTHLGCKKADGTPTTIVRRTTSTPIADGPTVHVKTTQAQPTDVLKNAEASLLATPTPASFAAQGMPQGEHCSVTDILRGTCTTDFECSKDFAGWSYNADGKVLWKETPAKGVTLTLTCTECHFDLGPFTLAFDLQLVNSSVHNISLSLSTPLDLAFVVTFEADYAYETSATRQLALIKPDSVKFHIGSFPVEIDWQVPVTANMNVNFNAQASLSTGYTATGNYEAGVYYDGRGGISHQASYNPTVHKPTFSHSDSGSAMAELSIVPKITASGFGSIDINLDNTVNANLNGASVTVSAEAKGTANANINLDLHNKHLFGPKQYSKTLYDLKKNLWPIHRRAASLLVADEPEQEAELPKHIPQEDVDAMIPKEFQVQEAPTHAMEHVVADNLKYSVTHKPNVFSLDFTRGVQRVSCKERELRVDFSTEKSAQDFIDLINSRENPKIVGHPNLGCFLNGKAASIKHLITAPLEMHHVAKYVQGSNMPKATVRIPVERAQTNDIVSSMKLNVDKFQPPKTMHKPASLTAEPEEASLLVDADGHWGSHFLHKVTHSVSTATHDAGHDISTATHKAGHAVSTTTQKAGHTISHDAKDAGHAVSTTTHKAGQTISHDAKDVDHEAKKLWKDVKNDVKEVVDAISPKGDSCSVTNIIEKKCTTQIDCTHTLDTIGFDFSGKVLGHVGPFTVTCEQCFARLTPKITLEIDIHDDDLETISAIAEADYGAEVLIQAAASASFTKNFNVHIFTVQVPTITFMIGVFPVVIDISLPISASAGVQASASASASAGYEVSGSTRAGFEWQKHHGIQKVYTKPTLSHQYIKPKYTLAAQATLNAGVLAELSIVVEDVLQAQVDANAGVKVPLQLNQAAKDVTAQLDASVDVDVKGSIGLVLHDVHVGPKLKVGPYSLYKWEKELWHGTMTLAELKHLAHKL